MINLTGNEEVPPVQTNTTGTAEISAFDIASDSISYAINVPSIQGAIAGHTHLGKQGEIGPIVVTFFRYGSPMNEVKGTGTITADMPEGPMKGKLLSELALAGANGSLYINIHTEQYPDGENSWTDRKSLTKKNEYPKIFISVFFCLIGPFLVCEMLVRLLPVQLAHDMSQSTSHSQTTRNCASQLSMRA